MKKVSMEMYLLNPGQYQLRSGHSSGAPDCPFGNKFEWIGFDLENQEYVRFTKSVFKKLIGSIEEE